MRKNDFLTKLACDFHAQFKTYKIARMEIIPFLKKDLFFQLKKQNFVNIYLFNTMHIFTLRYEPPHGKTNNLHMRKQRCRSASR